MAGNTSADLNELLKLHHDRLAECRRRNELLVERTIGAVIILVGFLVFGDAKPTILLKLAGVLGVVLGSIGICTILYKNNRSYLTNARVIKNLNQILSLYETKAEIDSPIYPNEWRSFGDTKILRVCFPFWGYILSITIIAAVAICIR